MTIATIMARAQSVGETDADANGGATGDDGRQSFTIAGLAREFDVTARTIRFYEDQGLIHPTRQGLNRVYSRADRFRLSWILRGKRLGFSLAEIRELLDLYETDRSRISQLKAALKRAREHVVDMERKAHDLQAQINELRELEAGAVEMLRERGADPERD
ncbi:MAG: MerR family DNA-binding transcriptional regulator [Rhodospirillales bacterium]